MIIVSKNIVSETSAKPKGWKERNCIDQGSDLKDKRGVDVKL